MDNRRVEIFQVPSGRFELRDVIAVQRALGEGTQFETSMPQTGSDKPGEITFKGCFSEARLAIADLLADKGIQVAN